MNIADDIQAQLEELWENAEQVAPEEGDTYIGHRDYLEGHYSIGVARWPLDPECYRVLKRAKPERPHVVMAGMLYRGDDELREPFVEREDGRWESADRSGRAGDLIDPVPLVEMPDREALLDALVRGYDAWAVDLESVGGADGHRADAVLELLRGERKA